MNRMLPHSFCLSASRSDASVPFESNEVFIPSAWSLSPWWVHTVHSRRRQEKNDVCSSKTATLGFGIHLFICCATTFWNDKNSKRISPIAPLACFCCWSVQGWRSWSNGLEESSMSPSNRVVLGLVESSTNQTQHQSLTGTEETLHQSLHHAVAGLGWIVFPWCTSTEEAKALWCVHCLQSGRAASWFKSHCGVDLFHIIVFLFQLQPAFKDLRPMCNHTHADLRRTTTAE